MYRALYRKWRPQKFRDVVGQQGIVTALRNQIAAGRIGHAYLFTGTRGTGKTTCARIFASAINCLNPQNGEPCGVCTACSGIRDGSMLDVQEIDAASNNSVDDVRVLRDQVAYQPAFCRYKVYIIDEVHMLSGPAFNALLKTIEEPPEHVIFILATTEVNKVPTTILSRCQRYDFARITQDEITARLLYVAGQEEIALSQDAAALIARLADGAMRDALSILDTCAGVSADVDEALVRRMAGVTDKTYLFRISDAIAAADSVAALEIVAELRQNSVDMRRLCGELAAHYRNLMLASLPGGEKLLTGTSPEEEKNYLARRDTPRAVCVQAIETFGKALEHIAAGADQRLELELALFTLSKTEEAQPNPARVAARVPLPKPAPAEPGVNRAPAPTVASAVSQAPPTAAYAVNQAPASAQPAKSDSAQAALPNAPAPRSAVPPATPQQPVRFAQWPAVLSLIAEKDPLLSSFLHDSKAYYDGRRVLIACSDTFREFMRRSGDTGKKIKEYIYQATGVICNIGPYEPDEEQDNAQTLNETMQRLRSLGVTVEETN